jgi:hypothetical protein
MDDLNALHQQIIKCGLRMFNNNNLADEERIFHLYKKLKVDNDIDRVCPPDKRTLVDFLSTIQVPNGAFYTTTEANEIDQIYWINDISLPHKIHIGMWADRSIRASKRLALTWCTVLDTLFLFTNTIIAAMGDHTTKELYKKIGAVVGIEIPEIWGGYDMCYMYLTRKNFNDSLFYKTYDKIRRKEK